MVLLLFTTVQPVDRGGESGGKSAPRLAKEAWCRGDGVSILADISGSEGVPYELSGPLRICRRPSDVARSCSYSCGELYLVKARRSIRGLGILVGLGSVGL